MFAILNRILLKTVKSVLFGGAQRENLTGTAIIFEMDNLEDVPRLLGELSLPAFDNKNVFMWECPDLLKNRR